MVICFFSAQYLPTVGGVERYTNNLAIQCAHKGHRVKIVTCRMPGMRTRETDTEGIEVLRLPCIPLMNGRFPLLKPCRELLTLLKEFWAEKPDFCVINARFYPSSLYAAFACKKQGVPCIEVEHSTGYMPLNNPLIRLFGHIYEDLSCRFLHRYCHDFYGVSNAVCHWLSHFGVKAKGTLYNAIDPESVQKEVGSIGSVDWHQRLGISLQKELVVYAGRVIQEKGPGELLRAFKSANLSEKYALVIAGDGPYLPELQEFSSSDIHFTGSLSHAEVLSLLSVSCLYCLPTRYAEGFPTTFLEAAACSCPILTTKTGGSEELFPNRSFGFTIPIDYSEQELRDELVYALSHPEERKQAAVNCQKLLYQSFTWDKVSDTLINIANKMQGESRCKNC